NASSRDCPEGLAADGDCWRRNRNILSTARPPPSARAIPPKRSQNSAIDRREAGSGLEVFAACVAGAGWAAGDAAGAGDLAATLGGAIPVPEITNAGTSPESGSLTAFSRAMPLASPGATNALAFRARNFIDGG